MSELNKPSNKTKARGVVAVERMVRPMDCYVGIKSCGCMVAWVFDDKKYPKDVAKSVAEFIKNGYTVERANTEDIRSKLGSCKCNRPNDQAQAQPPTATPERKGD